MKEIKLNRKNFEKFYKNIRIEDFKELRFHFSKNTKKNYYKEVKKLKKVYFLSDKNNNPIALGGVEKDNKNNDIGQVWLLCTRKYAQNKIKLYKYIAEKIKEFKEEYKILYNFIYFTNYEAERWLSVFGFNFKETKNPKFKLFYYTNGELKIDI